MAIHEILLFYLLIVVCTRAFQAIKHLFMERNSLFKCGCFLKVFGNQIQFIESTYCKSGRNLLPILFRK